MKRKLSTRTLLLTGTSLLVLFAAFQLAERRPAKPSLAAGKAPAVQSPERFSLNVARRGHTMTALPDGRVVIIGGENETGAVAEAEILDSASASLTIVARSLAARSRHSATLLSDGRVLVIGGTNQNKLLNSTELFDPATGKFTGGPGLNRARAGHTATELGDGRLLVTGGNAEGNAEILTPGAGRFTLLSAKLVAKPSFHAATLLADGNLLLVGGVAQDGRWLRSAELFDASTMSFEPVAERMWIKRVQPAMRLLPDGKVQVIGGDYDGTMEVYDPARKSFRGAAHLLPTADIFPAANVMAAKTREAMIDGLTPPGAEEKNAAGKSMTAYSPEIETAINAVDDSIDRTDYATAEIAGRNQAVVAGGLTKDGQLTKSVVVLASSKAELTTDKVEYQQGESPFLSGNGWQPDEKVQVVRQNARPGHKRQIFNAVADQQGNIAGVSLPAANYAEGMTYTLTAMGESSGRVAQTVYSEARDAARQGPDKIAYSFPFSFRDGSVETDAGIFIWEVTSGGPQELPKPPGSPFLAPNAGFTQTFTFGAVVDRPCLGIPAIACPIPSAIDMRLRSGSSLTVGGSVDGDISVSSLSASASVNENLRANLLFDITANGKIELATIPIPGASATLSAELGDSGIGATLTFGIVAKPSVDFTAPGTKFLVGFNFSQNAILGAKVSTSGITPIRNVGTPSFSPTFQVVSTNGGCLALDIGPEIKVEAGVSCGIILGGSIGVSTSTGLFAFGEACLEFDRSDPNCVSRDIAFYVGSRGYANASASLCSLSVSPVDEPFTIARVRLPIPGLKQIVEDLRPPTIAVADLNFSTAPGQCSAVVSYTLPAVSDNCSGVKAGSLSCNPPVGAVFVKGMTTVTCTARDNFDNVGSAAFRVNVTDNENPILLGCLGNITRSTDPGQCSAVVNFTLPQATDNCSGVTVASSPPSGFAFPVGRTEVVVTATDAAGNKTTCAFSVIVSDTEAPVVACPANIVQSTDPGQCSAVVRFSLPAPNDNCPGVTVASSIASGAVFQKGTTPVTVTATDAAGNRTSCSFTVTVVDRELPVLAACPTNITQSTDPGLCSAVVRFTLPTATDNCPGVVVTSSHQSGAVFPKGTTPVTVTATDAAGNRIACSFTVTVVDTEAPLIGAAWPNPSILADPDGTMRNVTINYPATDNCPGVLNNLSISSSEAAKGVPDPGAPPAGRDWEILNDHRVRLRAERLPNSNGRIYTITIGTTDESGNQAVKKAVTVKVPRQP